MHLDFLINVLSSNLNPYIISPTILTSRILTRIDNIMSNVITEDAISGYIINTIPDHLGQFLILPQHSVTPNAKGELYRKRSKLRLKI